MKYNNIFSNKIHDILAPLIGEYMADAAILTQAKKLGRSADLINKNDLPKIAQEIKKSLFIFLGSEGAQKISAKIEKIE